MNGWQWKTNRKHGKLRDENERQGMALGSYWKAGDWIRMAKEGKGWHCMVLETKGLD